MRDKRFNPARRRISNGSGPDSRRYTPALAAMLIYLNRTGFNGLFRLNSQGEFNVPIGSYKNPQVCDADNLRAVAVALAANVTLAQSNFESVLTYATRGEGMSRELLKLSGSLVHDYATISDDSPSPNRASRARRAATSAGIS